MKTHILWSGAGAVIAVLVIIGIFMQVPRSHAAGPASNTAVFKVTSINMVVYPSAISEFACGTTVSVTWTAIIRIAANGPGGTIQLNYTWNEGRGSTNASVAVYPGATTAIFAFTHTDKVESDHSFPQYGSVQVTSPNLITAQGVTPSGTCHS
jgi:hypothetical protein